jgi:hypothetical protein
MRPAAIAEAAAHLRHLADQGRISATAPAGAGPGGTFCPIPADCPNPTEAGRISSQRRADGFEDPCLRGAGQGGGAVR